jgi:hypothetical protein
MLGTGKARVGPAFQRGALAGVVGQHALPPGCTHGRGGIVELESGRRDPRTGRLELLVQAALACISASNPGAPSWGPVPGGKRSSSMYFISGLLGRRRANFPLTSGTTHEFDRASGDFSP